MTTLEPGQCGLCKHFGEEESEKPVLHQIRVSGQAPEHLSEPCGHPDHEPLHLKVTPISGCEGFEPVAA